MGRTALCWLGGLAALLLYSTTAIAESEKAPTETPAPPCPLVRGETRAVARVVDGETLVLDDGRQLRLIGALAPRASDVGAQPGDWPAESETRAALSALVEGKSVALWHDAAPLDRYGQVRAHLMIDAAWVQGTLVARGLARVYSRPGMDACSEALMRLEGQARDSGVRLWGNAAYRVRNADNSSDLGRAVGMFQIVAGTVQRVSRGQGDVYVSLASRRDSRTTPHAFAAVVPSSRRDLTGGIQPRDLVGRRVRVRGWIEQRRGLVIVVDSKGQFELVGK